MTRALGSFGARGIYITPDLRTTKPEVRIVYRTVEKPVPQALEEYTVWELLAGIWRRLVEKFLR